MPASKRPALRKDDWQMTNIRVRGRAAHILDVRRTGSLFLKRVTKLVITH